MPHLQAVRLRLTWEPVLLTTAGVCWWLATRPMPMDGFTFSAYVLAWLAMMAAMMLPALTPVVRLYVRAAERGRAAPVPVFVSGYLLVWTACALPAYVAYRALRGPLMDGTTWTAYVAGGALLAAAAYQLSPLKAACLTKCRSPLTVFSTVRGSLRDPSTALRVGAQHGLYCVGCCWVLFAVLVVVGTMQPLWMIALTAFVLVEKSLPHGDRVTRPAAAVLGGSGFALLVHPSLLMSLTI